MDKVDVGLLADAHAEWFAEAMRWVYRQAFIHGYKHGKDENKESLSEKSIGSSGGRCKSCGVIYLPGADPDECFHGWEPVAGEAWRPRGWKED